MKVLLDTNVIVDILGKTEDVLYSYAAVDTTLLREFEPCICAGSLTDIVYLLSARKYRDSAHARAAVEELFDMFEVLDTTSADCRAAHQSGMQDFEDAVIAHTAQRCGVDIIVTRDRRGFTESPVPALSPQEFLDAYKPVTVTYAMQNLG